MKNKQYYGNSVAGNDSKNDSDLSDYCTKCGAVRIDGICECDTVKTQIEKEAKEWEEKYL